MMAIWNKTWLLLLLTTVFLMEPTASAHTGIGSGGDVIAAYLEETRALFVESLQRFQLSSMKIQENICDGQGLEAALKRDCATFLRQVAGAMSGLHSGPGRVPFELSKDPVTVTGPGGSQYRVAAKTLTGPDGSVTFDYGLILRRSPKLLMALVAHETSHKVEFRHGSIDDPRLYIEDDAPVLAFPTGRALLDAAGLAIANFAEHTGIIGQKFSVRDKFYCEIRQNGGIGFYQSGDDVREFSPSDDKPYDAFRTGIGPDRKLQIGVSQGNSCLSLNVMLHESTGCQPNGNSASRFVDLKIYRLFRRAADGTVREPELLRGRKIDRWNPACEDDQTAREQPMSIEAENIVFTCTYKGMVAAAYTYAEKMERLAGDICPGS